MRKNVLYILLPLLIMGICSYTGIVNADEIFDDPTVVCGDRTFSPAYEHCCDGIIYPITQACPQEEQEEPCNGIKLNTNFPIIGNCIETKAGAKTNPTNAFPYMLGVFTKIIMSVILVVCFILIIVAGIMWASSGDKAPSKAKELIKKVAITILLLGLSGLILKLINPNFFG